MNLAPPAELSTLDDAWYSIAVDVDQNGIDNDDLFKDRFQITSVPYSLSGVPAPYWASQPILGIGAGFTPWGTSYQEHWNDPGGGNRAVWLTPFVTPPGGVEFTKISGLINPNQSISTRGSFGVYDTSGTLVVSSGPIIMPPANDLSKSVHFVNVTGRLKPSTIYYAAHATNSDIGYGEVGRGPLICTPGSGFIQLVVNNGLIPNHVDLSTIRSEMGGL